MLAEWLMFQVADLARIMEAAVEAECVKVIRALHQKWPMIVDITDSTGSTPLFEAACRGQDAMIYLLGELGAKSFLWCGDDAVTPMEAAIMAGHASTVKALHDIGCTYALIEGSNAMHDAVKNGHLEVVKVLHQINPKLITAVPIGGRPPLHSCVVSRKGTVPMIELLCQLYRSAVDQEHPATMTPMHCISKYFFEQSIGNVAALHRYGSEAHFLKTVRGQYPGEVIINRGSGSPERMRKGIVQMYFSRSLTEILFFAVDATDIKTERRL